MLLNGKKIIILVENLYQEMEVWYPYYRLKEEGAEVFFVGSGSSQEYKSKLGYPCQVHLSASDVATNDYDAVIIPGGYAPDIMRRYSEMVNIVKHMNEQDKIIGAICHAGWMLVSADILNGRKATCFFAIKDDLIHAGAKYEDAETIVDGNLITARKPDDLPAFMREIIKVLS